MPTPLTEIDPVAAAEAAISNAGTALAAVHDRLRAGADVTAAELGEAEMAVRLATRRRDLAREVAAEQAAAAESARRATLARDLATRLGTSTTALETARAALEAAIDAWFAACRAHDDALSAAIDAASRDAIGRVDGYGMVSLDGQTYRRAPAQHAIHDATAVAVKQHYGPRAPFDLMNLPD
jgi:hypothetical protein